MKKQALPKPLTASDWSAETTVATVIDTATDVTEEAEAFFFALKVVVATKTALTM